MIRDNAPCEAVRKATHVEQAMQNLGETVSSIAREVDGLEERLSSVLSGTYPTPPTGAEKAAEQKVPLAETIGQQVYMLQRVLEQVTSIVRRIEL